jgi:hypothetical protein
MVVLYVGGNRIGTWAESEQRVAELTARNQEIELRDETGKVLGRVVPGPVDDPDWVKEITPEEVERRMADPGLPFEEVKKRLGWERVATS